MLPNAPHLLRLRHDHLSAALDYVWAVLEYRLRVMQATGIAPLPDDPYPGVLVSPLVAEVRFAQRAAEGEAAEPVALVEAAAAGLAAARERLDALGRLRRGRHELPLLTLREAFGLDDVSWLALLVAVAAELEPEIAPTLAYLQGHFERRQPTPALIGSVVGDDATRLGIRGRFEAGAPLVDHGLVELDAQRPFEALVHRGYRAVPRVLRFLEAPDEVGHELAEIATVADPDQWLDDLIFATPERDAWDAFRQFVAQPREALRGAPLCVLRGPRGAGRSRWMLELARKFEMRTFTVDLGRLVARFGDLRTGLRLAAREALLLDAVCGLAGWEAWVDAAPVVAGEGSPEVARERHRERAREALDAALHRHPGLVCLSLEAGAEGPPEVRRGVAVFEVPTPSVEARRELWVRHLPPAARVAEVRPRELARRFTLTAGRIAEAAVAARAVAQEGGRARVTLQDVGDAVRAQVQARMGGIAKARRPSEGWEDLVVAPELEIQLQELCHRYRHRERVLDDWGLRRRFASGAGLSALFEGPPGTGKTMAAGIIARELGLDLYQVDLSQIVSKWIGETEKNLSKVFDEAERSGAMLLFDEADSLFSKRTSVSSANDRYANLEVNYLLQRVEAFTGVAVLTTNFADSIDSAFSRRLSMRVTFPAPTAEERARLWQTMLAQPRLPVGAVDAEALAEEFELAGGLIKNAVLRAAFLAASRGLVLDTPLLQLSARVEMKEQGMLIRGNPHAELTALLARRR